MCQKLLVILLEESVKEGLWKTVLLEKNLCTKGKVANGYAARKAIGEWEDVKKLRT